MKDMKVRKFLPRDRAQVDKWCRWRDMAPTDMSLVPKHGSIVDDIAVGFLYLTDSNVCYIDNFMTNPETTKDQRRRAISTILNSLRYKADMEGYQVILGYTNVPSLLELLKDMDWKDFGSEYHLMGIPVKRGK